MFKILKYPDPFLLKPAEPVTDFGERLRQIAEEMLLTMYQGRGVGLAGPQVGIGKRLYVLNCEPDQPREGELILVNPEVLAVEGEQLGDEGCLSFPGIFAEKVRPERATLRAQNVEGEWFEISGEGLLARALLHELDHLDGRVFIEDLELVQYLRIKKDLEQLKRAWKRK